MERLGDVLGSFDVLDGAPGSGLHAAVDVVLGDLAEELQRRGVAYLVQREKKKTNNTKPEKNERKKTPKSQQRNQHSKRRTLHQLIEKHPKNPNLQGGTT